MTILDIVIKLIKNDLRLLKNWKLLIIAPFLSIIIVGLIFKKLDSVFYSYFLFLCTMVIVSLISNTKNNFDMIILSIPVKKQQVVKGKYLSIILYTVTLVVFNMVLSKGLFLMGVRGNGSPFNIKDALFCIGMNIFLFSFYNPFTFKLDKAKMTIVNGTLPALSIICFSMYQRYSDNITKYVKNLGILNNLYRFLLVFVIFSLVIYFISYAISKVLYQNKNFV